jgi:F-box protein 11
MSDIRPTAFMSYAREDNKDNDDHLKGFRDKLEREIRMHTAEEDFTIFQDDIYVRWGEQWEEKLLNSLDDAIFFIPIITPRFFKSEWCKLELTRFLERQEKLKQQRQGDPPGIIYPIYYIDHTPLNDKNHPGRDELIEAVLKSQHIDWRKLRREPFSAKKVKLELDKMARHIRDALGKMGRG